MTTKDQPRPTVVVVGGGYAGITVAKALDETTDVVLVEPKDAFMHTVAALRALVEPSWVPKVFFPYGGLLANGRIVNDHATLVEPGRVVLGSGTEIAADYVVLATGSAYPFPAKTDLVHSKHAQEQIRVTHDTLSQAEQILLLGAGPVGIELAGEIRAAWPDKTIVLLDERGEILGGGFMPELREELVRQLVEADVTLMLGSALRDQPPTEPGTLKSFTVTTKADVDITADIWFRCYGVTPNSSYLSEALAASRRTDGFIEVGPTLQVAGQSTVFALGDVSTADVKMAGAARREAEVVVANITALMAGESELTGYASAGPAIAVPIGPTGGAGQFPGQTEIVGREVVSEVKGRDLMLTAFAATFGVSTDDVAAAEG